MQIFLIYLPYRHLYMMEQMAEDYLNWGYNKFHSIFGVKKKMQNISLRWPHQQRSRQNIYLCSYTSSGSYILSKPIQQRWLVLSSGDSVTQFVTFGFGVRLSSYGRIPIWYVFEIFVKLAIHIFRSTLREPQPQQLRYS